MTLTQEHPATPATKTMVDVYCGKTNRKTGHVCGHKIASVDLDWWEQDMASKAELFCSNCHNAYTLADYLGIR